jgi:hypothetical protein
MALQPQKQNLPHAVYWFTALAFVLRFGSRLLRGPASFFDNGYTFLFSIAQSIATGYGISGGDHIPETFRVPLYPIFLAGVPSVTGRFGQLQWRNPSSELESYSARLCSPARCSKVKSAQGPLFLRPASRPYIPTT